MDKIVAIFASRDVRGWIYNVTIAALAVLMVYGLLNGEQAAAWLGLVAAIVGMARANLTPDADPPADTTSYDPKYDG